MESNNTVASPQLEDIRETFRIWREENIGSFDDFYTFMTTPSPERETFVMKIGMHIDTEDGVATQTNRG